MRSVLTVLVLLAGCSGGTGEPAETSDPEPVQSACAEVRAGIDAFNEGDYEDAVVHFERAVPLAEAERQAEPSRRTEDLLEAVRWYADLAPEEYEESFRTSPDFKKYQVITLGQCVQPVGDEPEDDGLTV